MLSLECVNIDGRLTNDGHDFGFLCMFSDYWNTANDDGVNNFADNDETLSSELGVEHDIKSESVMFLLTVQNSILSTSFSLKFVSTIPEQSTSGIETSLVTSPQLRIGSLTDTPTSMSRKNVLNLTRAPISRKILAHVRLVTSPSPSSPNPVIPNSTLQSEYRTKKKHTRNNNTRTWMKLQFAAVPMQGWSTISMAKFSAPSCQDGSRIHNCQSSKHPKSAPKNINNLSQSISPRDTPINSAARRKTPMPQQTTGQFVSITHEGHELGELSNVEWH